MKRMEIYGMMGERLGTIGQPPDAETETSSNPLPTMQPLPRWKQEFLAKPSISVRKGIAWGYSPPYEDTSTLVLTSTTSTFVDIRLPAQPSVSEAITFDPAFWAFSGTSSTTFHPDGAGAMPYSAHSVWKHDIDSKGPGISDEGDLFLLPNGDCIEVGMMENPRTKQVELYKEYWTEPPVDAGSGGLKKTPCVVVKTFSSQGVNERTRKGIIIRIGDHCQGILEPGEGDSSHMIVVERWVRTPVEQTPALASASLVSGEDVAHWIKDWRSNTDEPRVDVVMPCMWACDEGRKLGDEIVTRGERWRVTEVTR